MKVLISHPNWPEHVNKTAGSLEKLGLLDSFWTTIALPYNFFFKKRYFSEITFKKIKIHFVKEFFRNIFKFFKIKSLYFFEDSYFSINSIYSDLDLKVSKYLKCNAKSINVVYGYQNCTLRSFRIAKNLGIKNIYELLSPYWRFRKLIMEDEIKLQPEWKLSQMEILSTKKSLEEEEEIILSDKIVVASKFTMQSLKYFKEKNLNINIIPYGVKKRFITIANSRRKSNEKLKIIFAGRLILSKGIQYLISLLETIDIPWEAQIAGSLLERPEHLSKKLFNFLKDPRCKYLGQIPNEKLMKVMENSHVFMLPSLYEGFGLTLLEAMSCGLPVITTENTAGPDFIKNGENGFITPIRDTKITANVLQRIYENEELRLSISEMALSTANHHSWERYNDQQRKIFN
jgi:glycosyltransferase involved in cell wall biosynthesis